MTLPWLGHQKSGPVKLTLWARSGRRCLAHLGHIEESLGVGDRPTNGAGEATELAWIGTNPAAFDTAHICRSHLGSTAYFELTEPSALPLYYES